MTREELNKEISQKLSEEHNEETKKRIIKTTIKTTLILVLIFTLFFTYTTYIATAKVGVREYRVTNSKIPDSFNGIKVIQFSDLHYGTTITDKEFKKIVELINERKPDLVLFTGDLIMKDYKMRPKEQEKLINNLKNISSTLGKYFILGDEDGDLAVTILNQGDFIPLKDEYDLIYADNTNPILLVGVNSMKKEQNIEKAYSYFKDATHNDNIYTISMLHEADITDDILDSYKSDLLVAGHSHNGNVRIPFTNRSIFKSEGSRKYDQDYYHVKDSELYVSSGLGSYGMRFFCRPSINFFRLSNK